MARRRGRVTALGRVLSGLRGRRRVSRMEIVLALPDGSERVRSRARFLERAVAEPGLAAERVDRREHLLEWIRYHATRADWPRGISLPGRQAVCEDTGMGVSTYKVCRAWWAERGYVAVVREGRTEEYRRKTRRRDVAEYDGNDAKVYLLCAPKQTKDANRATRESAPPLTRPPQGSVSEGDPRACEASPGDKPGDDQDPDRTALRAASPAGPARTPARPPVPVALAAHPVLERLSDAGLASAWRPFAAAGWTPADWLHAIDWRPDGRQHRAALATIRHPAGWLTWRLRQWRGEDGRPVLSRRQRAAVRRLEEWRERQAAQLPPRTPGAEPGPEIGQLRAELAELNWKRKGRRS